MHVYALRLVWRLRDDGTRATAPAPLQLRARVCVPVTIVHMHAVYTYAIITTLTLTAAAAHMLCTCARTCMHMRRARACPLRMPHCRIYLRAERSLKVVYHDSMHMGDK